MIYPAEANIVPLIKSMVQGLQPYAQVNDVCIRFHSDTYFVLVEYHPFNLSQSLAQLICQLINIVPGRSEIYVRLHTGRKEQVIYVDVENTGINLMPVNQINNQCFYVFTRQPLSNGTLYRLAFPLQKTDSCLTAFKENNVALSELPKFYAEVRKRLRSHFTRAEKLVAALSYSRPHEACFLKKINDLIAANLGDEQFDSTALCKAVSMSRTQLFRRLKPLIRQAPAQYIKLMRLQKAKALLETTDLTIGEVAFKTGFKSRSHFTKVFLHQYDVLPSMFRRGKETASNE